MACDSNYDGRAYAKIVNTMAAIRVRYELTEYLYINTHSVPFLEFWKTADLFLFISISQLGLYTSHSETIHISTRHLAEYFGPVAGPLGD